MIHFALVRFAAALFLFSILVNAVTAEKLSAAAGDTPRSVRITGPKDLVDRGKGQFAKWVGCGYSVQWGDGSASPRGPLWADCAAGLRHTYQKAGTYRIVAKIYHLGPSDNPIDDWIGEAQFVVK